MVDELSQLKQRLVETDKQISSSQDLLQSLEKQQQKLRDVIQMLKNDV